MTQRPEGGKPITRSAMTKAEWAAYMREWRAKRPRLRKRLSDLDRSKPCRSLHALDPRAYHRQYRRWWRDQRAKKRDEERKGT